MLRLAGSAKNRHVPGVDHLVNSVPGHRPGRSYRKTVMHRGSFDRRNLLKAGAALGAVAALGSPARAADEGPQRQGTIIGPFAAGGSADLIGRLVAQHLQNKYGVPFVVENRGGAGGSIGTGYVAKAAPDGYTLVVGTVSTHAINASLYA